MNPKVMEGCLVGDKLVKGVPLSRSTQRDQERGAILHRYRGKGGPKMLGTVPSPRLATVTASQVYLGYGTHARRTTKGDRDEEQGGSGVEGVSTTITLNSKVQGMGMCEREDRTEGRGEGESMAITGAAYNSGAGEDRIRVGGIES